MYLSEIISFLANRHLLCDYVVAPSISSDENEITGFSSISASRERSITWSRKPIFDWGDMRAKVVICPGTQEANAPAGVFLLRSPDPRRAFFEVMRSFAGTNQRSGIAPSAIVGENVILGSNISIGSHSVIGDDCSIDDDTVVDSNVVIYSDVHVGKRCRIFSGSIIGADGFGYYKDDLGLYRKVQHVGGVKIGDDVEIGANACIDKGCLDYTVIGNNCKIDNLCHISHNVLLGANCVLVAGAIICGSVVAGDNCWFAPGSIVRDGVVLRDNVHVGMNSVVYRSVKKSYVQLQGDPAKIFCDMRAESER